MATQYKIAVGWDVDLVDMDVIVPEPRGDLLTPAERGYSITGAIVDQGMYVNLYFDYIEDELSYINLLTLFGLEDDGIDYSNVTVQVRNKRGLWVRYNGVALLPEPSADIKQNDFFLRGIVIRIVNLEPSAV